MIQTSALIFDIRSDTPTAGGARIGDQMVNMTISTFFNTKDGAFERKPPKTVLDNLLEVENAMRFGSMILLDIEDVRVQAADIQWMGSLLRRVPCYLLLWFGGKYVSHLRQGNVPRAFATSLFDGVGTTLYAESHWTADFMADVFASRDRMLREYFPDLHESRHWYTMSQYVHARERMGKIDGATWDYLYNLPVNKIIWTDRR